jgi:hypothetical protein
VLGGEATNTNFLVQGLIRPGPNEQYEELDISKNSGKPNKNTNFDKEDILANHKSFMSSLNSIII